MHNKRPLWICVGLTLIGSLVLSSGRVCYLASSEEASSSALEEEECININTASLEELEKIHGMTRETAEKILEEREQNGPFESLADVSIRIRGIGSTTVIKWKNATVE